MAFQIGMRDISNTTSSFKNIKNNKNNNTTITDIDHSQLMEFYWDIILLIESQFLCKEVTYNQFKQFRKFYLINNISEKLNNNNNNNDIHPIKKRIQPLWRSIADTYLLLYFNIPIPDSYPFLLSKQINDILNIIVPANFNTQFHHIITNNNLKNWLISLLELVDAYNCIELRLYLHRDLSWNDTKVLLKNLNWISGKILPNEDRNRFNDLTLDDLLLTDENFIVLQFNI